MHRVVVAVVLAACGSTAAVTPQNRVTDVPHAASGVSVMSLIDHPLPIGAEVTVDVWEPVLDSSQSSVPGDGELEVQLHSRKRFVIAPGAPLKQLPAVSAPLRVHGVIAADADPDTHEAGSVRLIARAIEPLAFPQPTRRASTRELQLFDRYVEVEGTYNTGYEWSTLDTAIWVAFYPHYKRSCMRGPAGRVRMTGFYHVGGGYGHMGHYSTELVVTELVEATPDCTK